jgi:hypothetical protein
MAQNNSSLFLILGGGALAWYGYTQGWFSSLFGSNVVTPAPVPSGSTTTCAPPSTLINGVCVAPAITQGTNPPTSTTGTSTQNQVSLTAAPLTVLLLNQAQADGQNTRGLNPDQWAYYYAQLPGRTALTAQQMSNILTNGNIADRTQPITAQWFAELVQGIGLTGFGQVRRIPVPTMVRPAYGKRQYTMADMRRAGRR